MSGIFLSYRREDSAATTGRLYDALCAHFGMDRVVRDVDTIPPGADFARWISDSVGSCDALVVVIGPNWLTAANAEGHRRLDDPRDFVRLEIAAALARSIPVAPVLVEGARLPAVKDLPRALSKLPKFQALELTDAHWRFEVQRLTEGLETLFRERNAAQSAVVENPVPDAPPAEGDTADRAPAATAEPAEPDKVSPREAASSRLPAPTGPTPASSSREVVERLRAPEASVEELIGALSEWFGFQGFEVQPAHSPDWIGIQVRQVQGWRVVLGMSSALHVLLKREGGDLVVRIGGSKWGGERVAGVAAGIYLTGGVTPLVGAWQQKKWPERTLAFVRQRLGVVAAPAAAALPGNPPPSSPPFPPTRSGGGEPATASPGAGPAFCTNCGAKATGAARFCASCGSPLG